MLTTPTIDRMAAEGMRFTQLLAGGPVCAPTRSCLMTGQHLGHTSVRANGGGQALREDDVTVARCLRDAGYATGGYGKWGLGDRGTTGVPERHGFDEFYGYYHQVHAHSYYPRYLLRNSRKEVLPGNTGDFHEGETFSHYRIVEEGASFIRRSAHRPFYCYLPWTPPHGLWGIPEDEPGWLQFKDERWNAGYQRRPQDARVYAAMVSMVDRQVGELLGLLDELGIADNTLVLFTGDNGGQDYFSNEAHPRGFFAPNVDPRTGQAFRGEKGHLYEGGLRIPAIAWWPGQIPAGTVSDHLCYFPDLMATLCELTGASPAGGTDGLSIAPTLLGGRQRCHEYLYWEFGGARAARMGDWKAISPEESAPIELYDLAADPGETDDLARERPEIVRQLESCMAHAHEPHRSGGWLPGGEELGFKGHRRP
ncbi:MAG: sulfatase-like hydrolase/transferase [Armatimonadia bacterium]|nr:sulfatase-like hydrolase/transferase [Armatimonadia bacterium]